MNKNYLDRIGYIKSNNYGSSMEVVEYNNSRDIVVRFIETDTFVPATWGNFIKGKVKNPYEKTIYSVGYLGEGEYKAVLDGVKTIQYITWKSMIERCYSERSLKINPTYIGCTVTPEWHNFQNFAKWFQDNYYEIEGEIMNLDKDILINGNKIYSPDTCVFTPHSINMLFVQKERKSNNIPTGVSFSKRFKKFVVKCQSKTIGYFRTIDDAFVAYKTCKEKLIKQKAEDYKEKIPTKLYEVMINYEVK